MIADLYALFTANPQPWTALALVIAVIAWLLWLALRPRPSVRAQRLVWGRTFRDGGRR